MLEKYGVPLYLEKIIFSFGIIRCVFYCSVAGPLNSLLDCHSDRYKNKKHSRRRYVSGFGPTGLLPDHYRRYTL